MQGALLALAVWTCGFVPPLPPRGESLTKFDGNQVELRRTGDRWQLWYAGAVLKDVGANERDAREAVNLIRQLRFNQRGVIGRQAPVLEYWLTDGAAPTGLLAGHQLTLLDRANLRVEQLGGCWCLRDASQVLFNFGPHAADAQQALTVIHKYHFNRIGSIGQGACVLIWFMGGHDAPPAKAPGAAPQLVISPNQLWQVRQLTPPNPFAFDPRTGEERRAFDWRRVELQRDGLRWKLMHNGQTLADFAGDEIAARDALRVIQFYRFTEQCRVGQAADYLQYFLTNGQAPQGVRLGIRGMQFSPDRLTVREVDARWAVCQGERIIVPGALSEEEARQALQVIQKYRFDALCRIGNDGVGLSFLVRER